MKYLFSMLFIGISMLNAYSQSKWSLQAAAGFATETNLGDSGLRLSTKVSREFGGRWSVFSQLGTFQMFRSNENWNGDEAYRELRSLSTLNVDLGGQFLLLNHSRIHIGILAGGSYRTGRQLWPEFAQTVNGHRDIFYTLEKISEIGYAIGADFKIKATERLWIGLDTHCHSYNYFGEYLGIGLNATLQL